MRPITFRVVHRAFSDAPPAERLEFFEALPASMQAEAWDCLRHQLECQRLAEGEIEWPSRRATPPRLAPRSPSLAVPIRDDVLDGISPRLYFEALTGEPVPPSGRVRCPAPGHEDVHPSCLVYREAGRGWWCPVCGAGGSAIDLAAYLTNKEPRGSDYFELRRFVIERLLGKEAAA